MIRNNGSLGIAKVSAIQAHPFSSSRWRPSPPRASRWSPKPCPADLPTGRRLDSPRFYVITTDMNAARVSSNYSSPLRQEQKAATRQRILDAAGRLMADRGLEDLSFTAIAKEAGVKERTVYRHFANKSALLVGLWGWYQGRINYGPIAENERDLLEKPLRTFVGFDENERLTRALWSSPQGRDFRLSNVEERKAGIRKAIADATQSLSPRQAKWLAAAIHVLYSGAAWSTMKDYWGLSGTDAGRASSFAIELLLNAARHRVAPIDKRKKR
jgi:AcrR family transcriptional regulator